LKAELAGGVEELDICRDQDSAFGLISGPGDRSGELQGISAFERKAGEQCFRFHAEVFRWSYFTPAFTQSFEAGYCSSVFGGRRLPHAQEALEGAADLDRCGPPDHDGILAEESPRCRARLLMNAQRDEGARIPKRRYHRSPRPSIAA